MQQQVLSLIKQKLIVSAHDVSEGGLFVTLLESSFVNAVGFEVNQIDESIRPDAFWFGESQSRVVVSVNDASIHLFEEFMKKTTVPFSKLGSVTGSSIHINGENWGNIVDWNKNYDEVIGAYMNK
jgi:phosphoribosylformylglycinamidine synthase